MEGCQAMRNTTLHSTPGTVAEESPNGDPTKPIAAFEPLPEWDQALQTWQWAWELHWAGLGALFALLALYALWSLIELLGNNKHKRKPVLALAISSLLFIFSASRALFLFINPYESEQCFLFTECPVILTRIMFGIALPCITASFSLIHLAFLQLSKLKLYPEKLQNGKFLSCIVAFHFVLALFTDVMISLFADWNALSIICQTFFIALSLILSGSFIYSGRIILKSVRETRSSILQMGNLSNRERRLNVSKLVKITFITVFVGFSCCVLQLYSMFFVYNLHEGVRGALPKPWPWLIFHSLYRVMELVAGCTIAYVSPRQVLHRPVNCGFLCKCCKLLGRPSPYLQSQSSGDSKGTPPGFVNNVRVVQPNIEDGGDIMTLKQESMKSQNVPTIS